MECNLGTDKSEIQNLKSEIGMWNGACTESKRFLSNNDFRRTIKIDACGQLVLMKNQRETLASDIFFNRIAR